MAAISKNDDAKLIDRFGLNEGRVENAENRKDEPQRLSDNLAVLIHDRKCYKEVGLHTT